MIETTKTIVRMQFNLKLSIRFIVIDDSFKTIDSFLRDNFIKLMPNFDHKMMDVNNSLSHSLPFRSCVEFSEGCLN